MYRARALDASCGIAQLLNATRTPASKLRLRTCIFFRVTMAWILLFSLHPLGQTKQTAELTTLMPHLLLDEPVRQTCRRL
jgi:hypothetical protein